MRRALPLLLPATLMLGACGSSSSTTSTTASSSTRAPAASAPAPAPAAKPAPGRTVAVAYRNIAISPAVLTVKVGTTIRWTNDDPTDHNVTSTSGPATLKSADFGLHGTYAYTVRTPGTIDYLCTIHPASMVGKINVVP